MSTPLSREDRLAEYFKRLGQQPPCRTAEEALRRVIRTLDDVEDAYSGVPKSDPPPAIGESSSRMYPPLADRIVRRRDGGINAQTKGHDIVIAHDGTIVIRNRQSGEVEFQQ